METRFAIPDLERTKLAVTIQLGDPLAADVLSLVIFFTEPSEVNWDAINDLVAHPEKQGKAVLSAVISSSPWSYRCCDYTVGALLGLVEMATGKHFIELPSPVDRPFVVKYYELT